MGGSSELARSGMVNGGTPHRLPYLIAQVPQIEHGATSKGADGSTLVMRRRTHREERITTEPIDGEDPKSRMYIHEAPESIPNTRL